MLGTLADPYATYYDADAFASFSSELEGRFSGVGLRLEESPEGLQVVTVFEGTPAGSAGIEVGERIVSVDGRDVRGLPIETVVKLVQGLEGSHVTLGLEAGSAGPRSLTLTRARIDVPNIEARLLPDGVGYVQLVQFSDDAAERVREVVRRLLAEGATGVVFDLRRNPGGYLDEAVDVTGVFVEDGPIVSVEERGRPKQTLSAVGTAATDLPLVVLVDQGSASASEIVAGAIQDLDRGTVVGEKTFGKGTVQTVRRLADGSGVKFTTARYFTPSGDSIEGVGVVPDEQVSGDDAQLEAARRALAAMVAGGPAGGQAGAGGAASAGQ
jgi:carboxyl-terminal processing protease